MAGGTPNPTRPGAVRDRRRRDGLAAATTDPRFGATTSSCPGRHPHQRSRGATGAAHPRSTSAAARARRSRGRADFPGRGALENVGLSPATQALAMLLSDSGVRGAYTAGRGVTGAWDGPSGRAMGLELKDALSDINKILNILVLTDDDVEGRNRVLRSPLPPDQHGPIPKVRMAKRRRSARTISNREWLANKAAEILRAAGARKIIRVDMAPLMLHTQSSMRMGLRSVDSVLDDTAEARWVKGIYVADNSALANGAAGANPTLTTQAVATRTAEKIFTKYFDGDPWVAGEAPVSSIDQAVTDAVEARGIT